MLKLLKPIQGFIYLPDTGSAVLSKSVEGAFGEGDYIKVFSTIIFQQDFSRVEESEELTVPDNFGLSFNSRKTFIELKIDY